MKNELKTAFYLIAAFLLAYWLPLDSARLQRAVLEAFHLVQWYAREHVLLCLVPAFFIAGAIGVFVSQQAVLRYFGPKANKLLSYAVASVSGTILAVCSCTVLPLFGGIYLRGAGLGPAIAFLYSGPAINVLAIVLTARILGAELGIARAFGAISFSVVIGGMMHLIFLKEERAKAANASDVYFDETQGPARPLSQTALFFFSLFAVLVFANWSRPVDAKGIWASIFDAKWIFTGASALLAGFCLWRFFNVRLWHLFASATGITGLAILFPNAPVVPFTAGAVALSLMMFFNGPEIKEWGIQTWGFAKQITPLLFAGVLAAGFFLGGPESTDAGIIPNRWIQALVGDSPTIFWRMVSDNQPVPRWLAVLWPWWTNFFASFTGALMYFATLTEVPILRGLMDSGMGKGPALALLLAGPALSLPNIFVINSILGLKKTAVFVSLVVSMATFSGLLYGALF